MFCAVYRTRHLGERRDREAIRRDRNIGNLMYGVRVYDAKPAWRVMMAQLIGDDGERYVVPMLDHARLLRIRGDGFLLGGQEVVPTSRGRKNIKTVRYPQAWWCVPIAPADIALASAPAGAGDENEQRVDDSKTFAIRAFCAGLDRAHA